MPGRLTSSIPGYVAPTPMPTVIDDTPRSTYAELMKKAPDYEYGLRKEFADNSDARQMQVNANEGIRLGRMAADMSPEERAFLAEQSVRGARADAGVDREMEALRARGEDLNNVDEEYMRRAYQPAYERLMQDYDKMDRGILEDMNARGISSQGSSAPDIEGVASTPEMYERRMLSRDTKNQLGRNMLEAQNQAVQQKLAQYQGRLAETEQANTRFGQNQAPVIGANIAGADTKLQARTGSGTTSMGQQNDFIKDMHNINTQRKIAGQEQMLGGIGMGLNFTGQLAQAAASAMGGGKK